jgi:hypothetical protein
MTLTAGALVTAAAAGAAPPDFPDVDTYPAVDAGVYQVLGAHPSTSGWAFSTPAGLRCQNSMIPELGVFCQGPASGAPARVTTVGASLTTPGEFGAYDGAMDMAAAPLLATGSKFAAGNGVVCAVPDDSTLACRAGRPASWTADTPDPPDRHYGEHGFVVGPAGDWAY